MDRIWERKKPRSLLDLRQFRIFHFQGSIVSRAENEDNQINTAGFFVLHFGPLIERIIKKADGWIGFEWAENARWVI